MRCSDRLKLCFAHFMQYGNPLRETYTTYYHQKKPRMENWLNWLRLVGHGVSELSTQYLIKNLSILINTYFVFIASDIYLRHISTSGLCISYQVSIRQIKCHFNGDVVLSEVFWWVECTMHQSNWKVSVHHDRERAVSRFPLS